VVYTVYLPLCSEGLKLLVCKTIDTIPKTLSVIELGIIFPTLGGVYTSEKILHVRNDPSTFRVQFVKFSSLQDQNIRNSVGPYLAEKQEMGVILITTFGYITLVKYTMVTVHTTYLNIKNISTFPPAAYLGL
jgi:hypothetical protein